MQVQFGFTTCELKISRTRTAFVAVSSTCSTGIDLVQPVQRRHFLHEGTLLRGTSL